MPRRETTLSTRKPEASQNLSYNSRQPVISKVKYEISSIGRSYSRVEGAKPFKDTCSVLLWRLPAQLPEAIQHQFVFSFVIASMRVCNSLSAHDDRGYGDVCKGGLQAPEVKPRKSTVAFLALMLRDVRFLRKFTPSPAMSLEHCFMQGTFTMLQL